MAWDAGEDPRLARAVRDLASDDELAAAQYRIVERAVRHGTAMTAMGRMARRAGEPVLIPALAAKVSLRFGSNASTGYRKLMFACAALAVLCMGAGLALISTRSEAPVEARGP